MSHKKKQIIQVGKLYLVQYFKEATVDFIYLIFYVNE